MKLGKRHGWFLQSVALLVLVWFVSVDEGTRFPPSGYSVRIGAPSALGGPPTCPKERKKLEEPKDCPSPDTEPTKYRQCATCQDAIKKAEGDLKKGYDDHKKACEDNTAACKKSIDAYNAACDASRDCTTRAAVLAGMKQKCEGENAISSANAAKGAKECQNSVKSCEGDYKKYGDDAKKQCKDIEDDAKKKENQNKQQQGESKGNQDKGNDNAKKHDSGQGGGMPQMPQIPQQQDEDKPEEQAKYPEQKKPETGETKKPEIETNKFTDKVAINGVGFDTKGPSTIAIPSTPSGGSFPASHDDGKNHFNAPNTDFKGAGPATPGGSVGGGGNSPLGTSGGSQKDEKDGRGEAKKEDGNPYEVAGGGGGKLGAPKGLKNGGENDAAIDTGAKKDFADVLGDKAPANPEPSAPGEDPDAGFTIFKMVSHRYVELKKRGSL